MRIPAALAIAVIALLPPVPAGATDHGPFWVRGYPEAGIEGCVWYVAHWSDGVYTKVPWSCPDTVTPVRTDRPVPADRGYPERGAEGCIWYVVLWADGVYSKVPFACPGGLLERSGRYTPGTLPPAGEVALTQTCSLAATPDRPGHTVRYPEGWGWNPGAVDCAQFGPPAGPGAPPDIAYSYAFGFTFGPIAGEPEAWLAQWHDTPPDPQVPYSRWESLTVNGYRAARFERIFQSGSALYGYRVLVGEKQQEILLVADETAPLGPGLRDYATHKAILDQMITTLRFTP